MAAASLVPHWQVLVDVCIPVVGNLVADLPEKAEDGVGRHIQGQQVHQHPGHDQQHK